MLDVADKPGCISKAVMRDYFETGVNNTPVLKANTSLGAVTVNGKFSHYADPDTDTMWLGFALGMRCAERVWANNQVQLAGEMTEFRYLWKSQDGSSQGWRVISAKTLAAAQLVAERDCPDGMRVACIELL